MSEIPKRRLRLSLDLEADTLNDLDMALESVRYKLAERDDEELEVTSGGYSNGWHLELICDPEQSGERYREQLKSWSAERKAARRGSA